MSGKLKILMFGPSNFRKGGLSKIAWDFYTNMDLNKFSVDFSSGAEFEEYYASIINKNGGHIYSFGNKAKAIQKLWLRKKGIDQIFKNNSYDCVHIHSSSIIGSTINYIFIKKYCKNIIIHSHASGFESNTSKKSYKIVIKDIMGRVLKKFVKYNNVKCLACSDKAAEWMFPKKIIKNKKYIVLKNGIDVERFIFNNTTRNNLRKELHAENKFIIGHIGRFTYPKNHTFLIDVFSEIYKRNTNAVLLLVGDGPLRSEIEEKANKLGLTNNVIFYGTTDKANEIYQAMDCFVLPSHYEGLPVVSPEAQASGLHTLFADTITSQAKITELLEYMSLSDSVEKWAEKILSYDNGYERKDMSEQIRTAGYDIKHSAKQLENIYLECAKN